MPLADGDGSNKGKKAGHLKNVLLIWEFRQFLFLNYKSTISENTATLFCTPPLLFRSDINLRVQINNTPKGTE